MASKMTRAEKERRQSAKQNAEAKKKKGTGKSSSSSKLSQLVKNAIGGQKEKKTFAEAFEENTKKLDLGRKTEREKEQKRQTSTKDTKYNPLIKTPTRMQKDTSPEIDNFAESLVRKGAQGFESALVGHSDRRNMKEAENYLTGEYKKRFNPNVRTGLRMNADDPQLVKRAEEQAKQEGFRDITEWEIAKANEAIHRNDDFYERKAKLDADIEEQNYNKLVKWMPEAAEVIGSMVPTMAVGAATGGIGSMAGLTGRTLAALQHIVTGGEISGRVSGQEARVMYDAVLAEKNKTNLSIDDYRDAIQKANNTGELVGIAEAGTEMLFGGIAFMGKGLLDHTAGKIGFELLSPATKASVLAWRNTTAGRISTAVAQRLGGAIGEGTEEAIMSLAQPAIESNVAGVDSEFSINDMIRDFGMGAAVSMILGLPVTMADTAAATEGKINHSHMQKELQNLFTQKAQELVASGEMTAEDAANINAQIRDIRKGKGVLTQSEAKEETKVTGENLDKVYADFNEARKAMMEEAKTKKDGEKITARYIDKNGEAQLWETVAKDGRITAVTGGITTKAEGEKYVAKAQKVASATNSAERTGYQLNVKDEIVQEVSMLSKAFNREVEFYYDENSAVHGNVDKSTGIIYVNANSSQSPARAVIAHEMTHIFEGTKYYNKLRDMVFKYYGNSLDDKRAEIKAIYADGVHDLKTDEEVDQEVMAFFVEEKLLTDAESIKQVVKEDRSLAQKIVDWLNKVIQKITGSREQKFLMEARDVWSKALAENKKGTVDGADKRYSISENLKEDLEKVKNGTFQGERNEVYIGETSKFLEDVIGVKPLSVTIPEQKAYSAIATEDEAKKDTNHKYNKNTNYHGLGVDGLFDLLVESENPLIAFVDIDESGKTDRYDRIVLVTDKKVNNGLGIVVTKVSAGAFVHRKSVTVNKTITVFDRKQIAMDFSRAFLDGRLLYVDEKRSQTLSSVLGANYQGTLRGIDFNKNIQQFWDNVNTKRGKFISQAPKKNKKRHSIGASKDTEYMDAVNRGDMEEAQRMVDEAAEMLFVGSKVRDENGNLRRVFHGTVNEFTVFDRQFANIEGDFGMGYYFTSNELDVDANYANEEGPDLKNKIAHYAERLEWDDEYSDLTDLEREEIARKKYITSEPNTIEAYLNMQNPVYINPDENGTFLDFEELYDEENDEYGEPEGLLVDFVEALNEIAAEYSYGDVDFGFLYEYGYDGGVHASDAVGVIKRRIIDELTDEEGDLAVNEVIRRAFEQIGFDGIIDSSVFFKFRNMTGMTRDTTHYIVFDSNQIKSAEPVTYDNNGEVVPLSGRFDTSIDDIRWSIGDRDLTYQDAVQYGNMEIAQKLVDEEARRHGYNSPKLYHGTKMFGFTKLRTTGVEEGYDWSPFFATSDDRVAETYSGETDNRNISDREFTQYAELPDESLIYAVRKYYDEDYYVASDNLRNTIIERYREELREAKKELVNGLKKYEYNEKEQRCVDRIILYAQEMIDAKSEYDLIHAYHEMINDVINIQLIKDYVSPSELSVLYTMETGAFGKLRTALTGDILFVKENGIGEYDIVDTQSVRRVLEQNSSIGIYSLYANTENLFAIDAKGAKWNKIPGQHIGANRLVNTREIAKYAAVNGYDGVLIRNLVDLGSQTEYKGASDIYIFFEPQKQIKSADPVTYDDEGNVIPLSERFNPANDDIRWSVGKSSKTELNELIKAHGTAMREVFHNRKRAEHKELWDLIKEEVNHIVETGAARRRVVDDIVRLAYETGYINNAAETEELGENTWGRGIYIPEEYKGEMATLGGLRSINGQLRSSGLFLTYNRTKKGSDEKYGGLDEAYEALAEANPILPETTDPAEQVEALIELFSKGSDRRTLEELDEEAYAMGEEDAPYLTSIRNTVEEAMDDIATFARWKLMQDSREEGVQAGIKRGKRTGAAEERKKQNRLDEATMREFDRLQKQRSEDERKDAEATMRMHDKLIKEVYDNAKSLAAEEKKELRKKVREEASENIRKRDIAAKQLKKEFSQKQRNAKKNLDQALKYAEKLEKNEQRRLSKEESANIQKRQKEVDDERRKERISVAVQEYRSKQKPIEKGSAKDLFLKNKSAVKIAAEFRRNVITYLVERGAFVETNGSVVLDENNNEIASYRPKLEKWDISKRRNTYTPGFGITVLAEKEGIDKDIFFTIYSKISDMRTSKDENGKNIYKKDDILRYISMLDLTSKQKQFLFFDVFKQPYTKMPAFLPGGAIKETAGNKRGHMIEALDNIALDMYIGSTKESEVYDGEKRINNKDILAFADAVYGKEDSPEKNDFLEFFVGHIIVYTDKIMETKVYTELLTDRPVETDSTKTRVLRWYRDAKKNVIAEGEAFERMGDKLKNPLIKTRYYDAKKAMAIANQMIIGDYQRNMGGKKVGKSLQDIFKPVIENDNLMKELTELVNYRHDLDRMKYDKEYTGRSKEECERIIERISKEHPELLKIADEIVEYSRNLLKMCVDCGLISRETYDFLQVRYPNYVPTYRVLDEKTYDRNGKKVSRNTRVLNTATKSDKSVLPLFDQLVRRTHEISKACKKNQLATELAKSAYAPNGRLFIDEVISTKERKAREGEEFKEIPQDDIIDRIADTDLGEANIIPWYSNGERYDIFVSDENLLYGWDRILPKWSEQHWQVVLRRLNQFKRAVLTQYNPTFFIKNHIKDTHDLFLYNQHAQRLPKYYFKAWQIMIDSKITLEGGKARDYLGEYLSLGMEMTSVFEYDQTDPARKLKRTKAKRAMMKPFDGIDNLNFVVEQVPRLAVYMETSDRLYSERKKGKNSYTDEEIRSIAGYQASDATLNFGRSGTVVKNLNTYGCTFLNAGVQGMDRARRAVMQVKDGDARTVIINIMGLLFKATLVGVGSGWIVDWLYGGDDEWAEAIREKLYGDDAEETMREFAEMTDYNRLNFLLLKINGEWIRLPRGRVATFIYSWKYNGAKWIDGEMDFLDLVVAQAEITADTILPPNPLNENILSAFLDVQKNRNAWGEPIVEEYEDKGKGFHYLEYDDNSTDLAIAIANFGHKITADDETGMSRILDISPKKLDYMIEQTFGSWYDFIGPFLDKDVKPLSDTGNALIGLVQQFYIDPTSSNRLAGDYYDLKEEFENISNAHDNDSPYAVTVKLFNDYNDMIKPIRDEINAIGADTSLSRKERLAQISELKEQMNDLYRQGIMDAKDLLGFATENYTGKDDNNMIYNDWVKLYKDADWRKASFNKTETENYNELVSAGLDSDTALKVMDRIDALEPVEGKSSVSEFQKVKAISDMGLSKEQEIAAMSYALNSSAYAKFTSTTDYGVTAKVWTDFKTALQAADYANNNNGSYDNDEKKAALDSLDISNETRAALWQINDNQLGKTDKFTSWKAGRNPYSASVGAKVVDSYMEKKVVADEKEESESYDAEALASVDLETIVSPVSGVGTLTSGYGYRNTGIPGASTYHQAVDIAAEEGTPIGAALSGVVTKVSKSNSGYGNSIEITSKDEQGNTIVTKYSHLSGIGVELNQAVNQGSQIGKMGNTGVGSGSHLDFKIAINGEWKDPEQYIDFTSAGVVNTEGYKDRTDVAKSGGVSVVASGGGSSGGSKKTSSIASSARAETKYDSVSKIAGNRSGGSSGGTVRGYMLPTASEIVGRSTKSAGYGSGGIMLPKASDYGTHQIRSTVATTKRTGRTGGSLWDPNVLS